MNETKYFETIKTYRLFAKKEVGQNFLISPKISKEIVGFLQCESKDNVLEIGPGAGSLSFYLALENVSATLMDIDEALIIKLRNDFKDYPKIKPVVFNALKADLQGFSKILGNLPYYITNHLLEKIFLEAENASLGVFMVQKEAFERITSPQKSKNYCPLGILLSLLGKTEKLLTVSPSMFAPTPHVDSVVFRVEFHRKKDFSYKNFYLFLKEMFLSRRKTLFFNFSNYVKDSSLAKNIWSKLGFSSFLRPEETSLEQFLLLYHLLKD